MEKTSMQTYRHQYYEDHKEKMRAYQCKYREKHKEEKRLGIRHYRSALKEEVFGHYGSDGKKACALCGIADIDVLCIDHINGNGNAHRRLVGGSGVSVYRWLKVNNFPRGFRILCCNCNRKAFILRRREK